MNRVSERSWRAWSARRRRGAARPRIPSVASAVGVFMATSLIGVVALATVGLYLHYRLAEEEAIRLSRVSSTLVARGVVGPLVTDELLAGDSRALAALDTAVREHVLDDEIVRVKVWQTDGRIVYSDQTELIGQRYPLGSEDLTVIGSGAIEREISDLERSENRFERSFANMLCIRRGGDDLQERPPRTRERHGDGRPDPDVRPAAGAVARCVGVRGPGGHRHPAGCRGKRGPEAMSGVARGGAMCLTSRSRSCDPSLHIPFCAQDAPGSSCPGPVQSRAFGTNDVIATPGSAGAAWDRGRGCAPPGTLLE